ncbi:MAG: N-succinyl-gamma-glutamyl-phosphate reductase [Cytophagales bacterium]|jgi:N-acetyl-gamma-glutamyl-phosphate reductase|nr:N-acetyl-gamma-glutamyl-phosphate reductase [Bacteroidota bacterium]MBS1980105.1 N-acetyl-gamma-glutamyl-phosphate reductase [Bacteroidota bacterium]WHZ08612.1 MAG: N-succinyl-gamma-glutamyl-phosphate reductase [Cytophagales bacterium]
MNKIKAGIIGAAGYTGGEMIRLLLYHPQAELIFALSRSQAGKFVAETHTDLAGDTDLKFADDFSTNVEVLFLCLSHGESKKWLTEHKIPSTVKIIDLGNDFRLGDTAEGREFVYGLPELKRDVIKKANNVANPGCFATTLQLGLLPLAQAGLLKEVHTTGITGSTGAGQKLQETTHFTWRANNISAYKTLTHQHLGEIKQTIRSLQPSFNNSINFIPWRGDFARGIYVSSVLECSLPENELHSLYKKYYQSHPFTHVSSTQINLKQVVNTNKCLIHLEKIENKLVVHSATDNLLKGASGQAVQNMNLMFGLDERSGLQLKSIGY